MKMLEPTGVRKPTPPEPEKPEGIIPKPPPMAPQVTENRVGTTADPIRPETLDQLKKRSGGG
jgi:hypothetical protein